MQLPHQRGWSILAPLSCLLVLTSEGVYAFAPSKLPRVESFKSTIQPRRPPMSSPPLQALALPLLDEVIQSTSTAFLIADGAVSSSAATGGQATDMLTSLLHTPTLWSILAMTSIVALLVAWEKAIE